MPRTKSALKAQRSSVLKRSRNARQEAVLDRLIRTIRKTESTPDELRRQVQQALDKAGKTGLMPKRRADRLKSRLLNSNTAAPKAKVAATKKKKATGKKTTAKRTAKK